MSTVEERAKRAAYMREWRIRNLEKVKAWNKRWKDNNREKALEYGREYFAKNRESLNQKRLERHYENRDAANKKRAKNRAENLERDKERTAAWRRRNRGLCNAYIKNYRMAKRRALPNWADIEATKKFYANCPEGHHVDHIIPLRGKTVSGLHVIENLQYLTAAENFKKRNKFEGVEV